MQQILTKGGSIFDHPPSPDRLAALNWEALRAFLVLQRTGSVRAAALDIHKTANTVRRLLDTLEADLGMRLVKRRFDGIELTPDGLRLYEVLAPMEAAVAQARQLSQRGFSEVSGFVRLSVTEGIGTFWVMPRLVEFLRAHPKLVLDVNCNMRPPNLAKMEADIGIMLERPKSPNLKAYRIGTLHASLFASPDYIETFGLPNSLADLRDHHKLVEQLSPQVKYDEFERVFPGKAREGFVPVSTNTSTAHFYSVASGSGVGMLPTYLWAIGARVEPVPIDYRVEYGIWLAYHPSSRRIRRIAATIEWLKKMFNPKEFAWFRDEYLPPKALAEAVKKTGVRRIYDMFGGVRR
jgi:DNA-binding transcriptional LysR family regulator